MRTLGAVVVAVATAGGCGCAVVWEERVAFVKGEGVIGYFSLSVYEIRGGSEIVGEVFVGQEGVW